jgi:hypothetical protein
VSRSVKRIRFGLVTRLVVASLPKMVKPEISSEATSVCRMGTARGEWEQRAEKEMSRNLGDPSGWAQTQPAGRMHKACGAHSEVGHAHSSEEGSNDPGAKGRGHGSATYESRSSA